jgi:hypothetical protein
LQTLTATALGRVNRPALKPYADTALRTADPLIGQSAAKVNGFGIRAPSRSPAAPEGHVAKRKTQPHGRGRPPVPELTLAAPKTTPFTPEQRAQFVALLTDMIVNYRQEQHLERAGAAAAQAPARQLEEAPGHSPAQ